jgi:ligand-binding sensor domain-containing protein
MKRINHIEHVLVNALVLILLFSFTACENNDEGLLDPDSAGVWTLYTSSNSELPGNDIMDMEIDAAGSLWMACYGHGIAKYANGLWTKYNTSNSGILSNNVTAIESKSDGSIIVGTSNGIAIMNASGQWSSYKDPLVTTMAVNSVKMTSDGSVWVGTSNEGFYISEATVYSHSPSGFTVYSFEEDKSGNVWMGASNGLFKWDGTSWTNISGTAGLPSGSVTSLYLDSKERLWIGILDNDKVYLRDNSGIRGISLMIGQTNNVIWDICEDKKGDMWFATYGGGLIRYDGVVPHAYKSYNASTSEVFSEDNVNCIARDRDGNMWFGLTTEGLVKYTLPLN